MQSITLVVVFCEINNVQVCSHACHVSLFYDSMKGNMKAISVFRQKVSHDNDNGIFATNKLETSMSVMLVGVPVDRPTP